MSDQPFFGNWMVAVAEAAAVVGAPDLDFATADQMAKAWELVREARGMSPGELASALADQAGLAVAALAGADLRAAILVPAEVAHRRMVLPLHCTDREIRVATANPLSQEAKRESAASTSRTVRFEVAPPEHIREGVVAVYGVGGAEGPLGRKPETQQPDGPHILVVDDEAGQRALFRSILEDGGYRVSVASDGAEALRKVEANGGYDLVTLDYWMDKMNGLRVLQHLRAAPATAGLPVIVVTGSDDRRIEMSLFEAGADDYIAKPIDAPIFLLRIQAVLRRRQFS